MVVLFLFVVLVGMVGKVLGWWFFFFYSVSFFIWFVFFKEVSLGFSVF